MSLVNSLKKPGGLAQVPDKLDLYTQLITAAEPLFDLENKNLEVACREHAQNLMFYSVTLEECKTVENFLRARAEEVEANLHKHYLKSEARALSATEMKSYIRSDPQYVEVNQILIDVAHTRGQLEQIVAAFQTMGWSLSNIVKLRIAQLDHVVL